jgi:U3 small nucleolar RNA-associated protein 19
MSLLSASLKSTNLQGYAVAAFIKRLMRLALVVPSPSALFCIAQVTWLLRNHPHCIGLLHNEAGAAAKVATTTASSSSSSSKKGKDTGKATAGSGFIDAYDAAEEANLERCNALQSSLWEALGLEHHHLHSVATLAKSLRVPLSTENSVKAPFLRVDDFLGHTYEALMESELAMAKKNSALAYKVPLELLPASTVTGSLFGV